MNIQQLLSFWVNSLSLYSLVYNDNSNSIKKKSLTTLEQFFITYFPNLFKAPTVPNNTNIDNNNHLHENQNVIALNRVYYDKEITLEEYEKVRCIFLSRKSLFEKKKLKIGSNCEYDFETINEMIKFYKKCKADRINFFLGFQDGRIQEKRSKLHILLCNFEMEKRNERKEVNLMKKRGKEDLKWKGRKHTLSTGENDLINLTD